MQQPRDGSIQDNGAGIDAGRRVHSGEGTAVAWSLLYFFCILTAYYVMRPVREQLSASVGSTQLPWFYAATFVATSTGLSPNESTVLRW